MANKNEAKIKFTAETGEFNDAIKKSNSEMSKLKAEMKLNEAQMKATGATVEGLEKKHELLESQLKASQSKTEALSGKVEAAARIFGENSEEVTKLKTQLANAQTAEVKLRQAVSQCADELDQQKKSADTAEGATKSLTDKIEEQQSEVKKLKEEYTDAVLQYGKNSKEAKELGKQIDNLSDELDKNEKELKNAEQAADKFDNSLDDAGESAEGFNGKMAAVAAGVAAAGAALVEFGKSSIEAFNEVDEGADNIVKATGATGEQAAELEEVYKNVASSVVGDFADMGSAIGEINTRFGYSGSKLEEASVKFQKFSEITGVDATDAVQSVSRALNDAGIPLDEYDSLLDQLAKAGQAAGIDVTTLADSLSKNGSIMRSMGFDTEETIALLSNFELAGADTSTMLTGMKKAMATWADAGKDGSVEFGKMVEGIQNGSVSASDAIDVFGTKAGPMLVDAIKSGKFEYEDMLKVIEGSKGTVENTFDGTVDGGYELELAMQDCKLAMAEVGGVVGEALTPVFQMLSETVIPAMVDGFGAFVEGIKSSIQWMQEHKGLVIAIASVIGVLVTAITAYNIVQGIKTAMDAANVTTVWALVAAHIAQAAAAMAAIAPYILIVAAIAAVIAIIVLCVKYWDEIVAAVKNCWDKVCATLSVWGDWINTNVIQPIVNFFKNLWDSIVGIFKSVIDWVKTNWKSILLFLVNPFAGAFKYLYDNFEGFRNFVDNIVSSIKQFFANLWSGIKNIFANVGSWFSQKFQAAKNGVQNAWSTTKNFFGKVWTGIKNTFANVGGWFKDKFKQGYENSKNAWNGVKSAFSSVWSNTKSAFSNVGGWFKDTFAKAKNNSVNAFSNIQSLFSNVVGRIKSAFANVKSIISKPFEAAKNAVKNVVDRIKGFFSGLNLKLPKIKLPHFKITGKLSLSPPSVPKLKIDWYKDGGIMVKPTIFGMNGSRLMAGGEAGPEAIAPIAKLQDYVTSAVERAQQAFDVRSLAAAIEDLANRPTKLYVGDREIALATASASDSVNGLRSTFKSRGLIVD